MSCIHETPSTYIKVGVGECTCDPSIGAVRKGRWSAEAHWSSSLAETASPRVKNKHGGTHVFNYKFYFRFMNVLSFYLSVWMCTMSIPGHFRGQKRTSDSLRFHFTPKNPNVSDCGSISSTNTMSQPQETVILSCRPLVRSHCVSQAVFKVTVFLFQPLECWDYRCVCQQT